jgi:phosphoesterase RecJ-like protein
MTPNHPDANLATLLEEGERFAVLTHVNADGDGVGSSLALFAFLRRLGKEARMIHTDPVPAVYRFLGGSDQVEVFQPGEMAEFVENADAIFVLDNGSLSRLGSLEPHVRSSRAARVCIDHHETGDDGWDLLVVDSGASATGEVLWHLFESMDAEVTAEMAEALYVSLVTDSGHFRFSKTSPATHRMAAGLLERGVRPEKVYQQLHERQSEAELRMMGAGLARLKLAHQRRVAWTSLDRELLSHLGALNLDTGPVVNALLALDGVSMALLLREQADGQVKVSLRSRGAVTVHELAQRHGGGGHQHAAGLVLDGPLEEAARKLVQEAGDVLAG